MNGDMSCTRAPDPRKLSEFLMNPHRSLRFLRSDALKGYNAVVIGARPDSIGGACAAALAKFGCDRVVVHGEKAEVAINTANHIVNTLGYEQVYSFEADLSTPGSGYATAREIERKFPGTNLCVYVSGLSEYYNYEDIDVDKATRLFQVNVLSLIEMFGQMLGYHLKRRESDPDAELVFGGFGSIQGLFGVGLNAAHYAASKAAVQAALRNIAVEYASVGVKAICVIPGCVDNQRHRETDKAFAATQAIGKQTPSGELASAAVVAEAFIAGMLLDYHVGQPIIVDGGWHASGRVNATGQVGRSL